MATTLHPDTSAVEPQHNAFNIALILFGNILPLLGVIFWDWDLANVILLYWTENLIIGFWTIAKMLTARGAGSGSIGAKLFICGFFTVHYGMFCMGHAAFILMIIGAGHSSSFFPFESMRLHGLITNGVLTGTAIMFVTHGIDFVQNFFRSDIRKTTSPATVMFSPYGHIVVIHIAILASAFIAMTTGQPIILLALIVLGKTALEFIKLKLKNKIRGSGQKK